MRRRPGLPIVAAAALVAGILAACTPTTSTTADSTTTLLPPPRSVLRVGVEAWPSCLNPLLCADDALQSQILQHVLPGAYRLDAGNDYASTGVLDGPAEVVVADSPPSGGPAMTVTYRLADDARWADGMPITSSDFVGTWRAVMTTPGADTAGYELITGVDDRDPLVAVVTLSEPYGDWRELFGGARNHLLQADAFGATTDLTGSFVDELPFSGGPYQLVSWTENEAVLARVDNDWDPDRTAAIDQVRFRPVDLDEVSADSFDVLIPTPGSGATPPDGYAEVATPTTSVLGVWFDQRSPVLQVAAHRRFLALALDRAALTEAAAGAGAIAGGVDCAGWIPGLGPWCAAAAAEFAHDVDQARAVLATEGWAPAPDGPLVREGELFTLSVTSDPRDARTAAVAAEVVATLARLGVTHTHGPVPSETWRGPRPPDAATGVGIQILDLGAGPVADALYDCADGLATSVIGWCPPENADTIASLATSVDVGDRAGLVATLGRRAHAGAVWLPVVQLADPLFARTDRVVVPEPTRAVGGPLADLIRFTVVD